MISNIIALLSKLQFVKGAIRNTKDTIQVSRGLLLGSSEFGAVGDAVVSGIQSSWDVWPGPTKVQPEPVITGFRPNIQSSNIGDSALGAGINAIRVHYLNTSGIEMSEDVSLNGATVSMVAADVMFIQCMHAIAIGSNLSSLGNIDALNGSVVVSRITISGNRCTSSMRQVPAGKRLLITSAMMSATSTKATQLRLRSTSVLNSSFPGVYIHRASTTVNNSPTEMFFDPPILIPSLATVKCSAWTNADSVVDASWTGWIEDI